MPAYCGRPWARIRACLERCSNLPHIEIDRNPKGQKIPGKVAFVATLLLPILGVACLVMPEPVAERLPLILGFVMLFVGVADIVTDILERNSNPGKITVGTDVVMIVLGVVTLFNTHESLNVIAVMWGLFGLENAASEIDESLRAHSKGGKWVAPLATGVFELVLGTMLLLAPIANLGHHVLLLGLELVVYPFHVGEHEEKADGAQAEAKAEVK